MLGNKNDKQNLNLETSTIFEICFERRDFYNLILILQVLTQCKLATETFIL